MVALLLACILLFLLVLLGGSVSPSPRCLLFILLQIVYHYTRDRAVLAKALLRRGCVPHSAAPLPATGLLDPAYQAYHSAAVEAQKTGGVRTYPVAPPAAEPISAA